MGNYISCVSSKVPSNVIKVIALYGSVQEFEKPIKAAELMLDNPHHFVCHSTALEARGRTSALSADEELEVGHLYFILPMHKLYSLLSPAEMASLTFKADSVVHRSIAKSMSLARILPVLGDLCQCSADRNLAAHDRKEEIIVRKKTEEREDTGFIPKLHVDDADDVGELRRLTMKFMSCKYWKPALETISESPKSAMSSSLLVAPLL